MTIATPDTRLTRARAHIEQAREHLDRASTAPQWAHELVSALACLVGDEGREMAGEEAEAAALARFVEESEGRCERDGRALRDLSPLAEIRDA